MNINEIRSVINKHGLGRPTLFECRIYPPSKIMKHEIYKDLRFFCEIAALPGTSFQTEAVKHKGYGLTEERPVLQLFEVLETQFIGDGKGRILDFFHQWMMLVNNFHTDKENSGNQIETFSYPKDYWGSVNILQLDQSGDVVTEYTLNKVFPKTMGSVMTGWDQFDNLMRIPVALSYRSWNTKKLNVKNTNFQNQTKTQIDNDLISPLLVSKEIIRNAERL